MRKIKHAVLACGFIAVLWGAPAYAQDDPLADTPTAEETAAASDASGETPDPEVTTAGVEPEKPVVVPEPEAAPAGQTSLMKLVDQVVGILIPAFLTLIALLVTFILNWIRKRLKLNVSDQQIHSWSVVATKAASRGAEWARAKAKEAVIDKKVPGPDVLDVAVDWAVDMGITFKLPEIGREKLIGLIESKLFDSRSEKP